MENNITAAAPAKAVYKRPSQAKEIWRRFRKGKGAVVGLICLVIILLAVLVGPLLIPYENATTQNFSNYLAKPSAEHLFGCDGYGRDILARVIHGGKTSLGIAILATMLATGMPIEEAVRTANRAAGVVVGKLGTATVSYEELF